MQRKFSTAILVLSLGLGAAHRAGAQKTDAGMKQQRLSGNPIIEGWYADPEAVIYGREYWIYPTYSDDYPVARAADETRLTARQKRAINRQYLTQTFLDAFSSDDLVHWQKHPRVLDVQDVTWAEFALWAPSAIHANGKYYLFFAANDIQSNQEQGGIGAAVADRPEGPFVFKRQGKYDLMWSEGGWQGPDCSVAYAIGDSPSGPFSRVGKVLQQDPGVATGAGHHSVIPVPGSDTWFVVYHRRPLGTKNGNHREVCIDAMHFNPDGSIRPVQITFEGVKARRLSSRDR